MGTPNILLTRIDNRLIHGQVGMTWTNTLGANLVIVANDDVADKAAPHQKILLVVRTPEDALRLVEGGVPLKEINVGNLHFSEGKKQISPVVSVDASDIAIFKKLDALGVKLEVKGIPNERGFDLMTKI